jgi:hypothetical protein
MGGFLAAHGLEAGREVGLEGLTELLGWHGGLFSAVDGTSF